MDTNIGSFEILVAWLSIFDTKCHDMGSSLWSHNCAYFLQVQWKREGVYSAATNGYWATVITCYKRDQVTYTRKRCCPILVDFRRPIYLHPRQTYVQLCFSKLAFKKHHKQSNHIFWAYVLYQVLIPRRPRQPICVCKCTLCHYKMVIQAPKFCTSILKSLQFLNSQHYHEVYHPEIWSLYISCTSFGEETKPVLFS